MQVKLHKNARTTPAVRAELAASDEKTRKTSVLAKRCGISEDTVRKWRNRTSFEDRSHTAHRLQTTLTPAQEIVAVHLRTSLLLSLDDLLRIVREIVREFICADVSRSGLDRCLRRHGVSNLRKLRAQLNPEQEQTRAHKPFKAYEPGYSNVTYFLVRCYVVLPYWLYCLRRQALCQKQLTSL